MIPLLLCALLGAALGAVTYAGLWWTARLLATSRSPLRLIATSFVLRTLPVLVAAVLLAARGLWWGLAAAAFAFLAARVVLSLFYGNVPGLRQR
ncbi:MAG: hypothetical protein KDD11_05805 [Acidobacteria bacterium]|nr:hypothetical protein [Acidobacteriota bacterium]